MKNFRKKYDKQDDLSIVKGIMANEHLEDVAESIGRNGQDCIYTRLSCIGTSVKKIMTLRNDGLSAEEILEDTRLYKSKKQEPKQFVLEEVYESDKANVIINKLTRIESCLNTIIEMSKSNNFELDKETEKVLKLA